MIDFLEDLKKYDFCDSIIADIKWDSVMRNLIVDVDYYVDKGMSKIIKLIFVDCYKIFYDILNSDHINIWGKLTINTLSVKKRKENYILTFMGDFKHLLLKVHCKNIKIID